MNRSKMSLQNFPHILLKVLSLIFMIHIQVNLAFCPNGCHCDDVGLRVHCVNANLDIVPILLNPGTKHLDLSHNHIKSVLAGFTFYHEMQYLDISYNDIASLGTENFISQTLLSTLIVSNNKLTRIQDKTFLGLKALKEADLSDNYLTYISTMAFNDLNQLQILDISNNNISNFGSNTFKSLKKLKILNLCKNNLKNISHETFEYLIELQELHLCSNGLVSLANSMFHNLKRLRHLSLYSNRLTTFHPEAFVGLQGLKFLDIHDNLLNEVSIETLSILIYLEELNFGMNSLESIPSGAFNKLKSLRNLHISKCANLTTLYLGAFDNLENLIHLEISYNPKLTNINTKILYPLVELKKLVLRGNSLHTIDQNSFRWINLQYIDIRDNKFTCNCSIKWIQELLKNKSLVVIIEDVICQSPEVLQGRMLDTLTDYDLECYSKLLIVACCTASTLVFIIVIVITGIIYYRHCKKMKTLVHDHWPEKIVATWRDPEYEKQIEDEEYTFQSARSISHIQIPVLRQDMSDIYRDSYPPKSSPHNAALEYNIAFKNTVKKHNRELISSSQSYGDGENQLCLNFINGTKDKIQRPLENPYATHSLVGDLDSNMYIHESRSPTVYSSHSIYAEPKIGKSDNLWKTSHQILKDSGYYSSEFLNHNGTLTKNTSNHKYRNGSFKNGKGNSQIPESDSGVFSLSHIYLRPTKPSMAFVNDGIYDNII